MSSASTAKRVRLALGPIQYYWPKEQMLEFYHAIESSPVDIVYLGETVCAKRRSFRRQDWIDIAEQLQAAGKQVILSTLALIEANSELAYVRKLCSNGQFMVEANDMSAVQLLAGQTQFVGGTTLNIYNPGTLSKLVGLGLTRWVMPVDASHSVLAGLRKTAPAAIESEVVGWGRLPIAYSARCYTARAHDVPKDDCGYGCIDYPDGLMVATREDESFLVINGIQTQSARVHNLVHTLNDPASGIDILRINPQSKHTERVISLFDQVRAGALRADAASHELEPFAPLGFCDGYWHNEAGMASCSGASGR